MGFIELAERRLRNAVVRTRLSLKTDPSALTRERALSQAVDADRILFVCLGNICRSPMAERYARRLLDEACADVEVDSAGFVDQAGRQSPEDAIAAAAAHGVDLADHRSTPLTRKVLASSDVVFVMDVQNYREIKRRFGPVDTETYFLGALTGREDRFEIADPNGRGPEAFASTYEDITDSVDTLVDAIFQRMN